MYCVVKNFFAQQTFLVLYKHYREQLVSTVLHSSSSHHKEIGNNLISVQITTMHSNYNGNNSFWDLFKTCTKCVVNYTISMLTAEKLVKGSQYICGDLVNNSRCTVL